MRELGDWPLKKFIIRRKNLGGDESAVHAGFRELCGAAEKDFTRLLRYYCGLSMGCD